MSHPLLARLRHADPAERRAACADAVRDPAAALLVEALAEVLGDPDGGVRRAACAALAAIGRERGGVAPALREALHADEPRRRAAAAFTLARLEPPGLHWVPALCQALVAPEGAERWEAARLLVSTARLHGEVRALLLGLVGEGPPLQRRMAACCLRELAPEAPETARALLGASRDPDPAVRRAALSALAALHDPPREVRERLGEARAADPDPGARRLAAAALGGLGAGGGEGPR